jgi:hypothetical protein
MAAGSLICHIFGVNEASGGSMLIRPMPFLPLRGPNDFGRILAGLATIRAIEGGVNVGCR